MCTLKNKSSGADLTMEQLFSDDFTRVLPDLSPRIDLHPYCDRILVVWPGSGHELLCFKRDVETLTEHVRHVQDMEGDHGLFPPVTLYRDLSQVPSSERSGHYLLLQPEHCPRLEQEIAALTEIQQSKTPQILKARHQCFLLVLDAAQYQLATHLGLFPNIPIQHLAVPANESLYWELLAGLWYNRDPEGFCRRFGVEVTRQGRHLRYHVKLSVPLFTTHSAGLFFAEHASALIKELSSALFGSKSRKPRAVESTLLGKISYKGDAIRGGNVADVDLFWRWVETAARNGGLPTIRDHYKKVCHEVITGRLEQQPEWVQETMLALRSGGPLINQKVTARALREAIDRSGVPGWANQAALAYLSGFLCYESSIGPEYYLNPAWACGLGLGQVNGRLEDAEK